jgi:hypothetical protein
MPPSRYRNDFEEVEWLVSSRSLSVKRHVELIYPQGEGGFGQVVKARHRIEVRHSEQSTYGRYS